MFRTPRKTGRLVAMAAGLFLAAPVVAGEVVLTSRDGGTRILAEILSFDDEKIRVRSKFGEYVFDRANVDCEGPGCPPPPSAVKPALSSDTEVTLTTKVGAVEITGELIDFDGTEFVVFTPTGEYRMRADRVSCSGAGCPESARSAPESGVVVAANQRRQPDLAAAPTVTLTTNVGAIEITGKLLEFTGTEYVLFTPTGEYRMQSAAVSCSGAACPDAAPRSSGVVVAARGTAPDVVAFDPARADMRIASADAVGLGLLPSLWRGYADSLGLEHELVRISDTESLGRFIDGTGKPLAVHFAEGADPRRPFEALIEKTAEFGMASRPPDASEAAVLRAVGAGDLMRPENNTVIAVESIAMIVHPTNPVDALSIEQIAGIYRGEITNWSQVGGADAPILVLSRNDDSGTREVFDDVIAGGATLLEGPRTVYPGGGNNGMRNAVLSSPNSIGYVAFAAAEGVKRLNLAGSCGLVSAAVPFSVKTEEYPLVRRHYLFSRSDNLTAEAMKFADYARSPASEAAIAASNLVNFAIEVQPEIVAVDRFEAIQNASYGFAERRVAASLASDLLSWKRLSTTIRFATGSSTLGEKEIADVERLIAYLRLQPEGTEVAVVGFADSVGGFDANLRLSGARATLVASAIDQQGGRALNSIRFSTKAFGELAPAACNTDENGRRINRRVEIWIRRPR